MVWVNPSAMPARGAVPGQIISDRMSEDLLNGRAPLDGVGHDGYSSFSVCFDPVKVSAIRTGSAPVFMFYDKRGRS